MISLKINIIKGLAREWRATPEDALGVELLDLPEEPVYQFLFLFLKKIVQINFFFFF